MNAQCANREVVVVQERSISSELPIIDLRNELSWYCHVLLRKYADGRDAPKLILRHHLTQVTWTMYSGPIVSKIIKRQLRSCELAAQEAALTEDEIAMLMHRFWALSDAVEEAEICTNNAIRAGFLRWGPRRAFSLLAGQKVLVS